jgi:hypothetical protein
LTPGVLPYSGALYFIMFRPYSQILGYSEKTCQYKHTSLFRPTVNGENEKFYKNDTRV